MENTYKTIAVFEYSYQAQILKGRLEADGIDVFLGDLYSVEAEPGASQAIGGVKVKVRQEDVIKAKRIKDDIVDRTQAEENIQCSICKSKNTELDTTAPKDFKSLWNTIAHVFKNLILNKSKLQYYCNACNSTFIK